jgi:hypothetical protein
MNTIARRLDIITNLLNDETPVHPIGCNCAIKSRLISHHSLDCPYRALREMVRVLRDRVRTADTGADDASR